MDYYGINVDRFVDELQFDFERQGVYLATTANGDARSEEQPENVGLEMNIFCEVYKAIKPDGKGGYKVEYVAPN